MRVVVTGTSGFLGSHVADHLASIGHSVVAFDARPSNRFDTVVGDLLDVSALKSAFDGIEAVCHLGAIGDVYLAGQDPALAARVNVTGTANVCEAALAAHVRRVILASTWEVYGEPRYQPMDELHPCAPDHPYSITKYAGELLGRSYAKLRGLDLVALRLGTAFGTRMRQNSVFSVFIRKALDGEPISIQGSGQQGRQFTHERDISRAFEAALTKGRSGETYNVVAERFVSIKELADLICAERQTAVVYGAVRPGDVQSARVSSELARVELAWHARVPLEEGLGELFEEARAAHSAGAA